MGQYECPTDQCSLRKIDNKKKKKKERERIIKETNRINDFKGNRKHK